MRRVAALLLPMLLAAASGTASAAAAAPAALAPTQRVRVALDPPARLETLLREGFDVVAVRPGAWADVFVRDTDAARLAALGIAAAVQDDAVEAHYAARAAAELAGRPRPAGAPVWSAARADGAFRVEALPPFGSGSMGGFWTLAEVKMKLDSLVASDTRDLVADRVDTIGTTVEGRPIWGLEIGKRASGPDPRPVVALNALTHAREPEGMQAVFYFIDDLLARYGTDPFATYLLEHRRIHIVPVVNPDGYAYNQTIAPGGGGAWRKNRVNNGSSFGVDLNRNFSVHWGFDNVGSSPTPSSDAYRGPAAFSEPESRAQRDLHAALRPRTGLSFHTYSDLFLHAWSYAPVATADSAAFYEWDDEGTFGVSYLAGQPARVLYTANGDFCDWTYGDTLTKPRSYAWSPEVGTDDDGFWPPPSRIVPLARENLRKCYLVTAIAGPWVRAEGSALLEGELPVGGLAHLAVRARNLGLDATPPGLVAALHPLDAGVEVLAGAGPVTYPVLAPRTSADAEDGATFTVATVTDLAPGRRVRFEVDFSADSGFFSRDTVDVIVGHPTVLLVDPCEGLTAWNSSGGWGVVATDAAHPDRYLADSPTGRYPANANLRLTATSHFDLTAGTHAWLLFDARWQFEQTYDGATVEASLDSVSWTPLAGRSTSTGVFSPQPVGGPVYQGSRYRWRPESVDLASFTGAPAGAVRLRIRTVSDPASQFGGFDLDSLRVLLYDPAAQPMPVAVDAASPARLALAAPYPDPARTEARLGFALPAAGAVRLEVLDVTGRRVRMLADGRYAAGRYALAWDLRDDTGRAVSPGLYLLRLAGEPGALARRLVVLH